MFKLVLSQGRLGDRKAGTIEGAALTAEHLAKKYGLEINVIGTPSPARFDIWRDSLAQGHETLMGIQEALNQMLSEKTTPVLIANTCSASIATLPVAVRNIPNLKLLWIDAHGDFNTPTTTDSGYLGGMVVAAACGLWDSGFGAGLRPDQVIYLGARDIDPAEQALIDNASIPIITPRNANAHSVLDAIGDDNVWIHIDWDVMEPGHIPADYSVPEGLLPEQLRIILDAIPSNRIAGIEIAEFHAPEDANASHKAMAIISKTVSPLFRDVKQHNEKDRQFA